MSSNYWKQGNLDNAARIKAAFKREGFATPGYDFGDDGSFFFTNNNNKLVCCCSIYSGVVDIIKTHPDYQELELPTEHKYNVGQTVLFDGRVLQYIALLKGTTFSIKKGPGGAGLTSRTSS